VHPRYDPKDPEGFAGYAKPDLYLESCFEDPREPGRWFMHDNDWIRLGRDEAVALLENDPKDVLIYYASQVDALEIDTEA